MSVEKREKERAAALGCCGSDVKFGVPAYGAFGSGGRVREIVSPRDGMALADAVRLMKGKNYVVLGGATDVLFPDGDYDGIVVSTLKAKDVSFCGNRMYCSAGARLPEVVKKCVARGLSGLEQLSGIPGSVGGAIAMNAGAFGREIAETLVRVDAVTREGDVVALSPRALDAGYRRTCLTQKGLTVLGAEFSLAESTRKEVRERVEGYAERRRVSQPAGRSLGSVFKRVDGVSAGYYIERAGLKGEKRGGAEISSKHANFIVNSGGATSGDFVFLAELAKNRVYELFGKKLEYEVIFL